MRIVFHIEADTPILRNVGRDNESRQQPYELMRMPAYSKVARHEEITAPASVRMELRVEEADQNIKAGRVNAFVSPEDLIEDLG